MIELRRTSAEDSDFCRLVELLDSDLWSRYPTTQQNYINHNIVKANSEKGIQSARAIVAYHNREPVGCGCFRETSTPRTVEIKRMYVKEGVRRRGIATAIIQELEGWAIETGAAKAILETGKLQPEAVALYQKSGYRKIENFAPYVDNEESICMAKDLPKSSVDC
jgi:GNAT superfamily N-acetyltransferase